MKIVIAVSRVIVGTLFVLSGLIKANDPHGFSYKLDEYFTVFSEDIGTIKKEIPAEVDETIKSSPCFSKLEIKKQYTNEAIPREQLGFAKRTMIDSFHFFSKHALFLAVLICVVEIVLGLFVIVGFRMRIVSWLLFLMIVFFTFLTFYSAYFNKVTDCGCFGDALKLTPWQSFGKDIFLLVFIIPIFIHRRHIKGVPLNNYETGISIASLALMAVLCFVQFKWMLPIWFLAIFLVARIAVARKFTPVQQELFSLLLVTVGSCLFTMYCIMHFSVRDYRPWRIGNNIREQLVTVPELAEVEMVYLNKTTCEEVRHSTKEWSWLDSTFEANHLFYKQDKKVIKPAVDAKIKDFSLENPDTGEPFADSLISFKGYAFLLVAPNLDKTNTSTMARINAIADYALANGMIFVGGTSSTSDVIDRFRHEHQNMFPIFQNDDKALKTILRSDPGLVLVHDGVVKGKWHYNDIPSVEKMKDKYLK